MAIGGDFGPHRHFRADWRPRCRLAMAQGRPDGLRRGGGFASLAAVGFDSACVMSKPAPSAWWRC